MKPERSTFAEHAPVGFPNQSAIRERLTRNADVAAVEFWESDFDRYAIDVLNSVRETLRCSDKQANILAKECLLAACRRQRATKAAIVVIE